MEKRVPVPKNIRCRHYTTSIHITARKRAKGRQSSRHHERQQQGGEVLLHRTLSLDGDAYALMGTHVLYTCVCTYVCLQYNTIRLGVRLRAWMHAVPESFRLEPNLGVGLSVLQGADLLAHQAPLLAGLSQGRRSRLGDSSSPRRLRPPQPVPVPAVLPALLVLRLVLVVMAVVAAAAPSLAPPSSSSCGPASGSLGAYAGTFSSGCRWRLCCRS